MAYNKDTIFGSRDIQDLIIRYCDTKDKYEIIHRLIIAVCAAYRTGSLSLNTRIYGLFEEHVLEDIQRYLHGDSEDCPQNDQFEAIAQYNSKEPGCQFCTSICSSIHLGTACEIRCALFRGEEFVENDNQIAHGLCLTAEEKVDIIASRNGGKDAYMGMFKELYSKDKMTFGSFWNTQNFHCDSNGNPDLDGGKTCEAFVGRLEVLNELVVLIMDHGFPFLEHSKQYVFESLFKFMCQEDLLTLEKDKCFMGTQTFNVLCAMDLPLDPKFFVLVDPTYLIDPDDEWRECRGNYYHDWGQNWTDEDSARLHTALGVRRMTL